MKKLLLACCTLIMSFATNAQITLEHTVVPSSVFGAVLLTDNGTKFYMEDTGTNVLKILNTDYSVWRTINLPILSSGTSSGIGLISDKLFDSDDEIELLFYWADVSTTPPTFHSKVVNEDGSILLDIPGGYVGGAYYIDGNYKLGIYCPSTLSWKIYGLPGSMPCGHCSAGVGVPKDPSSGNTTTSVYPNPAAGMITITNTLPIGTNGSIIITGIDGKQRASIPVLGGINEIPVNIQQYTPGMYFYSIVAPGVVPVNGSFVR